jgi:hypothetical protein
MKKFLLFICVCGCFAATPLLADVFGVNFVNTTDGTLGNGPFTLGWSFTITQTIDVTDLAVFDQSGEALLESHDVGIWDSTGFLVDSATVVSGTSATLETDALGQTWRDVSAPVVLGPGTYTIGATWNNGLDPLIFPGDLSSITMGAGVTFGESEFIAGGSLTDPTNTAGGLAYFGPNFEYTATPEPSSMVLLGTVALGVGLRLRKALRKAN